MIAFVALAYALSWAIWGLAALAGTDTLPGASAFVAGGFDPGAAGWGSIERRMRGTCRESGDGPR